jgi:hypothetical protein
MQTDSRNHKVDGDASLARYLAIFSQKSNWKEKPKGEEKKKRVRILSQVNYRTSKQGLKTGNKLYSKQHETYQVK